MTSWLANTIAVRLPSRNSPMEHGQDVRASSLFYRSWALWMLGHPEAALADAEHMFGDVRELGQELLHALAN